MSRRIIARLALLGLVALAAFNGEGPWPPL